MSAIFGLLRRDGASASSDDLQRMCSALARFGRDGQGVWVRGGVGLGCQTTHSTPESVTSGARLPFEASADGLAITAAARLDNREELGGELGIRLPELRGLPDDELILQAYRRWGRECPPRLLGDWAFAIWDRRAAELFVARDHHGLTDLVYYDSPGLFAFSTSFKGVLALAQVPRGLDEYRVARHVACWPERGAATVYRDLKRLPPAHLLRVGPRVAHVSQYWDMRDIEPAAGSPPPDHLERFVEVYDRAVASRLRTARPVALSLSGGLDSGSIAALAAPRLAREGRRLAAFCAVPAPGLEQRGPRRMTDERELAEATCTHVGDVDLHFVDGSEIDPIEGIERELELLDEPDASPQNAFWNTALHLLAAERGFGTLLVGQHGNFTVSFAGQVGSLRPVGLRTLAELPAVRRARGATWWSVVRSEILARLNHVVGTRTEVVPQVFRRRWRSRTCLAPEFVAETRFFDRLGREPDRPPTRPFDTRALRFLGLKPGRSPWGSRWHRGSGGLGLDVRDPTIDVRVIETCLRLPDSAYARDGRDRLLIRDGFRGRLPAAVLENRVRGLQGSDILARLGRCLARLESEVDRIRSSPLARRLVDTGRLDALVAAARAPATPLPTRLGPMLVALSCGMFLARHEARTDGTA